MKNNLFISYQASQKKESNRARFLKLFKNIGSVFNNVKFQYLFIKFLIKALLKL